jgi:4-amino-4-deoxy-L-arabinose transferase-like glycosyltransferase
MAKLTAAARTASEMAGESKPRPYQLALAAFLAAFLLLALAAAWTARPFIDEALFATPSWNWLHHGHTGTGQYDPAAIEVAGRGFPHLDRHTYWCMPLYLWISRVWHAVTGFSLLSIRTLSMLWGAAALVGWFVFVAALSGDTRAGLVTTAVLAVDPILIRSATLGRMDIMSACLSIWAFTAYCALRSRSLSKAILASSSLVIASGLTHPAGGVTSAAGLLFLVLALDRRRLRWGFLWLPLIPGAVGCLAMALFVHDDPAAWWEQFYSAVLRHDRLGGAWHPLAAPRTYFHGVFWFFGPASSEGAAGWLKLGVPALYAAGAAMFLAIPRLRRDQTLRVIAGLFVVVLAVMVLINQDGWPWYLVHVWLLPEVLLTLVWWRIWSKRKTHSFASLAPAAMIAVLVSLHVMRDAHFVKQDAYHNEYLPVVEFLKSRFPSMPLAFGSADWGIGLGFDAGLLDDELMGMKSGRTAELILMDERYRQAMESFRDERPEVFRHNQEVLAGYDRIYSGVADQVYQRRKP